MSQISACSTVRYDTWSARHSIAYHAFFFLFFLVLSVDESVLSHCQLSLFCYGDKTAVTLEWASRGEKELDQDQQNSPEFFISFRCLFSCLIAICHSFISDLNCHNSLNAWQYPTLGCGSSSLGTKLNAGLALRQRADLLLANILANKIYLPQGQSYTERKYLLTAPKIWI